LGTHDKEPNTIKHLEKNFLCVFGRHLICKNMSPKKNRKDFMPSP